MNDGKRLLKALLYRGIGIIITTVFGLLVGLYCLEIKSLALAATIIIVYLMIVIFYIGAEQYRRFNQSEIIEKSKHLVLTREGDLLSSASQKIADSFKQISYQYPKVKPKSLLCDASGKRWAYNQKRLILQSICDILRQDRRLYVGPSDYFKATLFKVYSKNTLKLDCSYYPPGLQPITDCIKKHRYKSATAFFCLDTQNMQIIPNIPEEIKKGSKARWVELWKGQAERYGSMLSASISVGERATQTFEIVSILTIDTNRLDYFSEKKEDISFWSIFLAPFRAQLSFIYIMETGAK